MGLLGSQVSAENHITLEGFFFIFYGQKEQQKFLYIVASALIKLKKMSILDLNYMYSFGSKLAKNGPSQI